jgi:hypothetical protein
MAKQSRPLACRIPPSMADNLVNHGANLRKMNQISRFAVQSNAFDAILHTIFM